RGSEMHEDICSARGSGVAAAENPPLRCEPCGDERQLVAPRAPASITCTVEKTAAIGATRRSHAFDAICARFSASYAQAASASCKHRSNTMSMQSRLPTHEL